MNTSQTLSQTSSSSNEDKDWNFLREGATDNFYDTVTMKMPYNIIRTSHCRTYCKFNKSINTKHKYKIEKRECKGHNEDFDGDQQRKCPVEYKVYIYILIYIFS
jgi:2-iminoacetate synthase ThiH